MKNILCLKHIKQVFKSIWDRRNRREIYIYNVKFTIFHVTSVVERLRLLRNIDSRGSEHVDAAKQADRAKLSLNKYACAKKQSQNGDALSAITEKQQNYDCIKRQVHVHFAAERNQVM
jgi:hypothetical protein